MTKLNIDAEASRIFKPIEFTIDGKDYTVSKVESEILETMLGAGSNPRVIREAFASLVGAPSDEFRHTDTRKITLALRHITKITSAAIDELDAKNVQKESVVKTR